MRDRGLEALYPSRLFSVKPSTSETNLKPIPFLESTNESSEIHNQKYAVPSRPTCVGPSDFFGLIIIDLESYAQSDGPRFDVICGRPISVEE